jgi:hypothetical protein
MWNPEQSEKILACFTLVPYKGMTMGSRIPITLTAFKIPVGITSQRMISPFQKRIHGDG